MISIQHPGYIALFLLLFGGLCYWAYNNRQWVTIAATEQMRQAPLLSRLAVQVPLGCWFLVSLLLVTALADPQTRQEHINLKVKSKKAMLCVDASASMGEGGAQSAMKKIQNMLFDFTTQRLEKGDFVGISAYSGQSNSSRGYGYARIIQYPSRDQKVVHTAIKAVQPSMFGHYSAVGDGVLVSIIALIDSQIRDAMGEDYDRTKLEDNLWSLGSDGEDVTYAQEIASVIPKQKGRYIVLFTDGKFNTGIDPGLALWFAERIGLKVHFVAFESTAVTGLSREEQRIRKARTIEAVIRTGGMYKESVDVEGVAMLLQEINEAERVDIVVSRDPTMKSHKDIFLFAAVGFCILWLTSWLIWSDPL